MSVMKLSLKADAGDDIYLDVPGIKRRFGVFVEYLPFDDFVKVEIRSEKTPYYYLAHAKDVMVVYGYF